VIFLTDKIKKHLKHAFALEPHNSIDEQRLPDVLIEFAAKIQDKNMQIPAVMVLDILKPLNFIGSQLLYGAVPIAGLFGGGDNKLMDIAAAFEHRQTVELLIKQIEGAAGDKQ
jgi:hypothetical protein